MADDSAYDIMAQFWLTDAEVIKGESTLEVDKKDELLKGYVSPTSVAYDSNFFEVSGFSFSMRNEPVDSGARVVTKGGTTFKGMQAGGARTGGAPAAGQSAVGAANGQEKAAEDPYKRWRSAEENDAKTMKWQLDFDSFKLTRFVDGGSPTFFQLCGEQASFKKASVVKRVSLGGANLPQAYLRFDFEEVTLKNIEWSDGDLVTENFTFVCNKMKFRYRQQQSNGRLGDIIGPTDWDRGRDSNRKEEEAN